METTARLVEAQPIEDGTYPIAEAVFAAGVGQARAEADPARAGGRDPHAPVADYFPAQPRGPDGKWTAEGGAAPSNGPVVLVAGEPEREEKKELEGTGGPAPDVESEDPLVLKPVPGMAPHGPLSNVPMPIPPKPLGSSTPKATPAGSSASKTPPPEPVERPSIHLPDLPGIFGPGPHAGEPIPVGPTVKPTAEEQRQINAIGDADGCHRCGRMDPGTLSGNWVGDHQHPKAIARPGQSQYYFPHCIWCSDEQGGHVTAAKRRGFRP